MSIGAGVSRAIHLGKHRGESDPELAVNSRVRVYLGTDTESQGVIVEDSGQVAAQPVEIGDYRIVDPARQWAVSWIPAPLVR